MVHVLRLCRDAGPRPHPDPQAQAPGRGDDGETDAGEPSQAGRNSTPLPDHPTWTAGHGWSVFLGHPEDVRRTIGYIERNPTKIGLPVQNWPFVQPYDDWPLHEGHSPRSPYAKRLRELGRYP